MPIDLEEVRRRIQTRLKAFGTRYLKKRLEWIQPYPIGVRVGALIAIQANDWSKLARQSTKRRRDALRDLAAMQPQQADWGQLWGEVERMRNTVRKKWKPHGQRPEWAEARPRVIRALQRKGFTKAQAEKGADMAATASVDDLLKVVDTPLDWWARELEAGAAPRFSALAAADIADAVAKFNLSHKRRGRAKPKPAQNAVRKASAEIGGLLADLHTALRRKRRNAILTKARSVETRVSKQLKPLLSAAAYWAIRNSSGNNIDAGRRALQVADALRLALFTLSAARVVRWRTGWPEESVFLNVWKKAAKARSFKSAYSAPQPNPVADVARAPQAFDGKYISLEGRVGPVTIIHRGQKVVSSTSLTDGAGAVVAVGLTHIKLDSGGLVPGSYACLTGTFRVNDEDFPAPVLVLDRRNLTDDSRTSWLDWLTLELSPIVTPTPHGLCARWSWAPGSDGPGNLLRYGTWSATSRRRIF